MLCRLWLKIVKRETSNVKVFYRALRPGFSSRLLAYADEA
jgi:hypothetical protein